MGPWLYRRSVKKLAGKARQGDAAAVRNLAGILCTSRDETAREIARYALRSLVDLSAIDTLCTEVLQREDAALRSIVIDRNYLPDNPGTQALFLFVTGQRERYAQLDPQPHRPLLASGYTQATNRVRFQTRVAAKRNGQCPVLAAALMGTEQTGNPANWSDEEWEIVVTGLVENRQWETLWQLIVHAPLHLAITALSAMHAGEWKPAGDEQAPWEELTLAMPGNWTCPVPEDAPPSQSWSPDSQPLRLVFSGDGTLLAAACADGTICLWNTRTGTLVFRLHSGQGTISGLAISPDNTHLLIAGTGGHSSAVIP